MFAVTVGLLFTVMDIPAEVAVAGLEQLAFEVSIHVTICPVVNVEVVKVAPLVPALVPFICH